MTLAVADERVLASETVSHFRRNGWVKLEKFFSPVVKRHLLIESRFVRL